MSDADARRSRQATAVGLLLIVVASMPQLVTASVFPYIAEDLGMSKAQLGGAAAAFGVVGSLGSLLAGRVVGRLGPVRTAQLAATISALSCATLAGVAGSPAAAAAVVTAAGSGAAMAGPAASALLDAIVSPGRLGVALGLQWAGAPVAAATAGIALPAVADPFGWRAVFLLPIALAVVTIALVAPLKAGPPHAQPGARRSRWDWTLGLIVAGAALASAVGVGTVSFLVVALTDAGYSRAGAGLVLTATALAAAATRVAVGVVVDRLRVRALAGMGAMLILSALGFVLLATGGDVALAVGAVVGGGLGWGWQGLANLAVVAERPGRAARATSAMMLGAFAGGAAGPLLIGVLTTMTTFVAIWLVIATLALAGAAAVLAADRRRTSIAGPIPR